MPIYAYKCTACGHAQDVLQKISDKPLTVCPECHQETYAKQVTAAGFQLKGSGWYVTDFRNNGGGDKGGAKTSEPAPAVTGADGAAAAAPASSDASASGSGGASSTAAPASTSSSAPAPVASSASAPASSPSSAGKPAAGGSAA